jgi:CxxC motif-containing protein (DUF1111 family)
VIKPRLAPALYGVGLLEAIPDAAIADGEGTQSDGQVSGALAWHSRQGTRLLGRFGWQDGAVSIRDQTANAFAREMGLTSNELSSDDCTSAEADCRRKSDGGTPEVSADLLDAVVVYVRTLDVPESPTHAQKNSSGPGLFRDTGCSACHRPTMPVELREAGSVSKPALIAPYTDLRLHDLGMDMADQTASGKKVISRWRTAPLWGLGSRLEKEKHPTFLHDGRARSVEEAILWHGGEASYAKRKFANLGPRARDTLLGWIATL